MPFRVNGNSNYIISVDDDKVIKKSQIEDNRLLLSAKKQIGFKSKYFKVPKIYNFDNRNITMEYVKGDTFYDFFIRSSKRDLDEFIFKLEGYFNENIVGNYEIPIKIIKDKLDTFNNNKRLLDMIKDIEYLKVKIGPCHGDFTLSNMIFSDDIYLIDFLDSYLESPTMDILKLRQDTHLYWSFNMTKYIKDEVKLKIGLKYIDDWITETYDFEYYNLLQAINLYRIINYTSNKNVLDYLEKNISKLCERS
jgi:tRNA A-37 threonylcarbamoyl transferase component Bud32